MLLRRDKHFIAICIMLLAYAFIHVMHTDWFVNLNQTWPHLSDSRYPTTSITLIDYAVLFMFICATCIIYLYHRDIYCMTIEKLGKLINKGKGEEKVEYRFNPRIFNVEMKINRKWYEIDTLPMDFTKYTNHGDYERNLVMETINELKKEASNINLLYKRYANAVNQDLGWYYSEIDDKKSVRNCVMVLIAMTWFFSCIGLLIAERLIRF